MEKKEKKPAKREYPRKYPREVVDKVLSLIKEGKTMDEILKQVPPRKRAIQRYARKANLEIKK